MLTCIPARFLEEEKNDVETQTQISIKLTFIAVCFLKRTNARLLEKSISIVLVFLPVYFLDKPLEALFGSLGKLMLVGTVKSFQI